MKSILKAYLRVEKHIYLLILAQFSVQLINASFTTLRNYFMLDRGFKDFEIAGFTAYNYIAITLIAFPLGLYIKGRKLRPILTYGIASLPFIAALEIYAIDHHLVGIIKMSMVLWGIAFACISASATPYMLLNSKKETQSEVMALSFQTMTVATILVGVLHYLLQKLLPGLASDRNFLYLVTLLGLGNMVFLYMMPRQERTSEIIPIREAFRTYDWNLIGSALLPTAIIAIGAGLTIQFINLFFENVHHVDSSSFALMVSVTYILVALGTLIIPAVKKNFGYHIAITLIQVLAVIMLIALASTEWYNQYWYALPLAMIFFTIRQPLMNVAGPMTSELTMYYVGEKNRELVSSLSASIWSGSWFFSAKIFEWLRGAGIRYSFILLTTATLYLIGIYAYHVLIRRYYGQVKSGLIPND